MFFKVSAVHAYSHEDSDHDSIENCLICESAIENQNSEFLFQDFMSFEYPINYPLSLDSFETSFSRIIKNAESYSLFGRPPPALV